MMSPVLQAERQSDVLRRLLEANKQDLREKVALLYRHFNFKVTPFDIIVAISDGGRIDRDKHTPENVRKAESVIDGIEAIRKRHKRGAFGLGRLNDGAEIFSKEELGRIQDFLLAHHVPQRPSPSPSQQESKASAVGDNLSRSYAPVIPEEGIAVACPTCGSERIHIQYARNYYYHCLECAKNFPLNHPDCPSCGRPTKTRKQGNTFYRKVDDCESCPWQSAFHVNR